MATGSMQSPRVANAQVRLGGGKVLAVGGLDNNNNILASAEIYSRASGAWQSTGGLQTARQMFPAVVLTNGKVLVAGAARYRWRVPATRRRCSQTVRCW